MKKMATLSFVLLLLSLATSAFALDTRMRAPGSGRGVAHARSPLSVNATLGCDDGVFFSAYFQNADDRIGNVFNFGGGAALTRVGFIHFGFGFPGPYLYDIDIWDPTSCTLITKKPNLTAADAANTGQFEDIDLCPDHIHLTGNAIVMIHPRTCLAPNDCYPDIAFDDQIGVFCPVIINNGSTTPTCFDLSPFSGPFLLRIETDNCPVPTLQPSWGKLKTMYR